MIPTAHISATEKSEIAQTVIMPGDPLRAKFIAQTYLENVKQFNSVRNVLGFTGFFKGEKVSVMASGMGMPSMGIYSYELFKFYDVQNIIRVGSCGAYDKSLKLYDVILASDCYSESSYASVQSHDVVKNILYPSKTLNEKIENTAKNMQIDITKGTIHSSDVFYRENFNDFIEIKEKYGCIGVEMESYSLFHNANVLGKNAACILTVSDSLVTHEATTSSEREQSFKQMITLALNSI